MRVAGCVLSVVLIAIVWTAPAADAVSKAKACRRGCGAAIEACVEHGGKRARCKRQTLKRCRKRGLDTCVVTTTTLEALTTTTSTAAPTTTTTLQEVNGCTTADAVDRRKPTADRSVEFGPYFYSPQCIRIAAGQSVTFAATEGSSFLGHPLTGGEVVGETKVPDATSPIGSVTDGVIVDIVFPSPGTFPYYCDAHGVLFGMTGVVFVDPASP